jgi:hypothetical protein
MPHDLPPPVPRAVRAEGAQTALPLAVILIAFLLALPSLALAAPEDANAAPGSGLAADAGASAFGLLAPVKIAYFDEYPEDGTIGVGLVDRRGTKFLCGIDGGCGSNIASRKAPASRPQHLFVGATYPARSGARLLPLWGTEERSLLQLLTSAIADSISDAQNDFLLKGATMGNLYDARGAEFLRLIGGVERRRRMLAAVSSGEVAPVPDAFAYFGLRGPVGIQGVELDGSGRLSSIAVSDATGRGVAASVERSDSRSGGGAWSIGIGGDLRRLYVPLGGYEERYLLTVLSAALRGWEERLSTKVGGSLANDPKIDVKSLNAAIKTIQHRKDHIREKDRLD